MLIKADMYAAGGGTPKANVEFHQSLSWNSKMDVNFNVPSGIDEVVVVITNYSVIPSSINITGGDANHLGQNTQSGTGFAVVNIYTVKPTSSQINVKAAAASNSTWTISFIY